MSGLRFVIAGEGSRLAPCRELAERLGRDRIIIHSPWPLDETSLVLQTADVLVLPTRGSQSLASVPSKLISYMLAARPIIALAMPQSDIARIIEESGCGWVILPDQPELLAAQLRAVVAVDSLERNRRGQAGRKYALQNLTSEVCLPQVISILENSQAPGDSNGHKV
jgi:glycosyltransferase involved in cell wall biosynthesis